MDKITIKCQVCGAVKKIDEKYYGRQYPKSYCYCLKDTPTLMINIKTIKEVDKLVKRFKVS